MDLIVGMFNFIYHMNIVIKTDVGQKPPRTKPPRTKTTRT